MTPAERQGAYLYTLLTGKDLAKEVRAFSLTPSLRARYKHLYDQHLTRLHTAARQRLRLRCAALSAWPPT
jgi:hypothetical protein